jgi:peptide/nickel transport system substrate-binding protein
MNKLSEEQLTDDLKKQYAALDKAYMEQAVWAPYGNEEQATFVSDRIDFDKAYHHLLFSQDYSALALK